MSISEVQSIILAHPRVRYLASVADARLEAASRRAARKVGLAVMKSRRLLSMDNFGGLALIDPMRNFLVLGEKFDLSAQDVIEHCKKLQK